MGSNREAIREWRGYADEIQAFIASMDEALGSYENARRTELVGFAGEEQGWASGRRPNGDDYVGGTSSRLWDGDLLNIRALRGQFELPPPKVYFTQHRQALETSVARLHRAVASEDNLAQLRQGMDLLRAKMRTIRAGLLECALGRSRDYARRLHDYDGARVSAPV
jgi:hypothetical protein